MAGSLEVPSMTCAGANVPSSARGHEGLVLDPTAPAADNGDPAGGPTPTMQVGIASCIAPGARLLIAMQM